MSWFTKPIAVAEPEPEAPPIDKHAEYLRDEAAWSKAKMDVQLYRIANRCPDAVWFVNDRAFCHVNTKDPPELRRLCAIEQRAKEKRNRSRRAELGLDPYGG
jgi:hypothetical protein